VFVFESEYRSVGASPLHISSTLANYSSCSRLALINCSSPSHRRCAFLSFARYACPLPSPHMQNLPSRRRHTLLRRQRQRRSGHNRARCHLGSKDAGTRGGGVEVGIWEMCIASAVFFSLITVSNFYLFIFLIAGPSPRKIRYNVSLGACR
jgi:hypothetical protein